MGLLTVAPSPFLANSFHTSPRKEVQYALFDNFSIRIVETPLP